ncbi:MAG: hypothetical protein CMM81_06585 [Rhodospirillales bacterium]|nr:hypothetical protein [Rhodospirillales bacterium]HBR85334.1 hypothetical protein [Erythrobacter sp.]
MDFWVYMLRCSDGSYYVGSARGSLDRRVQEHQQGAYPGYTTSRRPVALVFSERFVRVEDAIASEQQLKGWSRAKKEALVSGDWKRISALGKRGASRALLRDDADASPQDEKCDGGEK